MKSGGGNVGGDLIIITYRVSSGLENFLNV